MIKSFRKRKGRVLISRPMVPQNVNQELAYVSARDFELAVEKEMCRSERRQLCFCVMLLRFDGISPTAARAKYDALSTKLRARLRIIDEIGIYQNELAILLPETLASEAAFVGNDTVAIGHSLEIKLIIEIYAYPEADHETVSNQGTRHRKDSLHTTSKTESQKAMHLKFQGPSSDVVSGFLGVGSETIKTTRFSHTIPTPFWKRSLDICGSVFGLAILFPLLLMISIAIKITSRGPVLFTQWREGKDGKLFKIYKFRTMCADAERKVANIRELSEQDGPAFKLKDDPRVTRLGRYLRKCCADELPQLVNVLRGQMSLVGPRPLPVSESYACTHWQRRRLRVLPGLTCFWQVEGGRETAFNDWMRMDLAYVRCCSLVTDVKLILKTVVVTVLHKGSV